MSRWCNSNCYTVDELFWNLELTDLKQSVVPSLTSSKLFPSRPSDYCAESSAQASLFSETCEGVDLQKPVLIFGPTT